MNHYDKGKSRNKMFPSFTLIVFSSIIDHDLHFQYLNCHKFWIVFSLVVVIKMKSEMKIPINECLPSYHG